MLKVLFNAGPIQNWIWKTFYNLAFRAQKNPDITALNYGYALLSDSGIYLEKFKDNINVLQYQMYDYLLNVIGGQKTLRGKTFIEVGCGRGGCFRYIVDEYEPARAIGVDISLENVNFCKVKQVEAESFTQGKYKPQATDVNFVLGDSQALSELFQDDSADVIMNIESSHCYGNLEAFFQGVCSVLKEDGIFVFADFRSKGADMDRTVNLINRYFTIVKHEDIRRGVLQAMNLQDDIKKEEIAKLPWYQRKIASSFAGAKGSFMYEQFATQNRTYFGYALRKKQ